MKPETPNAFLAAMESAAKEQRYIEVLAGLFVGDRVVYADASGAIVIGRLIEKPHDETGSGQRYLLQANTGEMRFVNADEILPTLLWYDTTGRHKQHLKDNTL